MREVWNLTDDWMFKLTSPGTAEMPPEDQEGWQAVRIPHDWAVNGEFSPDNDPQPLENSVLDFHENVVQIGRTGGLPAFGTGWYRRELDLPENHSRYMLEFDGIMSRGEVYVNGIQAAYRPYGYSSFCVDITQMIRKGGKNQLVVKVNALERSSRWYPGAGIYRPVRLVMCEESAVSYNGIWVRPEYDVDNKKARVQIECLVLGDGVPVHTVFDPKGQKIIQCSGQKTEFLLERPAVWDIQSPGLYTLMTEIQVGDEITDRIFERFGIRDIVFDSERGFILNGKVTKIQGVCMHHDCGMLGAAYNRDAVLRQLKTLKEMGCNALRTTHNPPQPDTLDLCDELGILVMEEAFDEWRIPKVENGYSREFDQWAERDLTDMIRRDRNHPSVIIYSIGNEVPDQTLPEGREICRWLTSICHREDPTRPVTCCFSRPDAAIENGLGEELDLFGVNYHPGEYERYHREHPDWVLIGSETVSCVSSRGEYFLPAADEMPVVKRENLQVNSYDLSAPAFCYTPDIEFEAQDHCPFICGCFVWTGYDYLGEPTPYREEWPSRSSYFGILDLAGLPKDRYWAYAAQWGEKDILHLLPHWNWSEGDLVDVHCYTNMDRVRLFLNGAEIGDQQRMTHRIVFGKIPFVPGELMAEGYRNTDEGERLILREVIRTAGPPYAVRLNSEKEALRADGKEICFVVIQIVDRDGNICTNADDCVHIDVQGEGYYVASDAGDPTSTRVFSKPYCEAFHGQLAAVVRAGTRPGNLVIHAQAEGLAAASVILRVEE